MQKYPVERGKYPTHEKALKALYEQREGPWWQWRILDRPEGFVLVFAPLWWTFDDEVAA